jgi:hypothetical protein
VDAALTAAVAAQDVPTLTTLLLSLQPAVMADTVLHHLHRLPPRAYLPPDDAPHEAWVEQLTAAVLAQQAQHAGGHAGGAAAAVAREPPPQASGREPSGPMAAEAQAPAAPVLPPVAPVTQTAVALTEHQAAAARRGAVLRMLGTPNLSARAARAALVARLAASSSVQEDIVNNVVGYLVQVSRPPKMRTNRAPLHLACSCLVVLLGKERLLKLESLPVRRAGFPRPARPGCGRRLAVRAVCGGARRQ